MIRKKYFFNLIGTSLYSGACFCVWPSSRELIVTVGIDLFTKTCRLCTLSPISMRGKIIHFGYHLQYITLKLSFRQNSTTKHL